MELKPLTIHFAGALHKLVQKNKKRLIRYFPITCSSTESIEKAKNYLENNEHFSQSSKTLIHGIFEDEKLVGIVFFKSFGGKYLNVN